MAKLNSEKSHALGTVIKEHRQLKELAQGLCTLSVSPATTSSVATTVTADGTNASYNVTVTLKDSNSETMTWVNTDLGNKLSINATGTTAWTLATASLILTRGTQSVKMKSGGGGIIATSTKTFTLATTMVGGFDFPQDTCIDTMS